MNGFFQILLYHFRFGRPVAWLAVLGLALSALSLPVSLVSEQAAFGLSVYGFIGLFAVPLLAAPIILCTLISNARLALVPGFPLRAGLALLALLLAGAAFLPLSHALYVRGPVALPVLFVVFACLSLYALVLQLALPSRYLIQFLGLAPFGVVIALRAINGPGVVQAWLTPALLQVLVVAVPLGWALGLGVLGTRSRFRPVHSATQPATDWLYWDAGRLERYWQTPPRSAAGTLLLGYSDSRSGRLLSICNLTLFTPLLSVAILYLLGFGTEFRSMPRLVGLAQFFLLMSGASALCNVLRYEDLAARARLLWLRLDGDRARLWRFLERVVLGDIALLGAVCLAIALSVALLLPATREAALHYWLVAACGSLFALYFSLTCQIRQWSGVIKGIGWSVAGALIGVCVSVGIARDLPALAFGAETLLLALVLVCRQTARNGFSSMDWRRTPPKPAARLREAV